MTAAARPTSDPSSHSSHSTPMGRVARASFDPSPPSSHSSHSTPMGRVAGASFCMSSTHTQGDTLESKKVVVQTPPESPMQPEEDKATGDSETLEPTQIVSEPKPPAQPQPEKGEATGDSETLEPTQIISEPKPPAQSQLEKGGASDDSDKESKSPITPKVKLYSTFLRDGATSNGRVPPGTPEREAIARGVFKGQIQGRFLLVEDVLVEDSPGSSRIESERVGKGAETEAFKTSHFDKHTLETSSTCTRKSHRQSAYLKDKQLRNTLISQLGAEKFKRCEKVLALEFTNRGGDSTQECPLRQDFSNLPLSPADAHLLLFAYLDIAEALFYLHQVGIVHRDLKPKNFLQDPETERTILADFGIARKHYGAPKCGYTACTPCYIDPRAFKTFKDQVDRTGYEGFETDIYAFARSLEESLYKALGLETPHKLRLFSKKTFSPFPTNNPLDSEYYIWGGLVEDKHAVYKFKPIRTRKEELKAAATNSDDEVLKELVDVVYNILETPPEHLKGPGDSKRITVSDLYNKLLDMARKTDQDRLLKDRPWISKRKRPARKLSYGEAEEPLLKKQRPGGADPKGKREAS